jgi:hypothetical protein
MDMASARRLERALIVGRWLATLEKYDAAPCCMLGADAEGRVILFALDELSPEDVRADLLIMAAKIEQGDMTHFPN